MQTTAKIFLLGKVITPGTRRLRFKLIYVFSVCLLASFEKIPEVDETTKYRMFCSICNEPLSTSFDYVVIKVKNLKTGELMEMCVTINFLFGAVDIEETDSSSGLFCQKYYKRYFEFSKDSAFNNIGFFAYSKEKLSAIAKETDVDSIVQWVKNGNQHPFDYDRNNENYIAHILFNYGVITTDGDFGSWFTYFK